ncbi:MAG: hypothetical protein JOY68_05490 [Candidatus Dormibacteraeota bacterium]|nr:hypothetical protein [Candidatus Dormibacteraeota bacterium]
MQRAMRLLLTAGVAASGFSAASAVLRPASAPAATPCDAATWSHHAALVVEHGDGSTVRICVGFDSSSISGADILHASLIEYGTVSYSGEGDAVCQIDHEPATYPPSCWTASSPYWAFFVSRGGGAWSASPRGIDTEMFSDGDAAGFRYDSQSGAMFAPVSPAGTCTLATPQPTPAPTAVPPRPTAAQTSRPAASSTAVAGAASAPAIAVQPSAAASSSVASPAPGVAAVIDKPATQSSQSGVAAGAVAAGVVGAALLGLLGMQLLRRRHR